MNATWDPPEDLETCVGKYVVQAWDQNNSMKEYETKETYYEFSPVVGCMTYNVQVKPWVNQSMEGGTSLQSLSAGDLCKTSLVPTVKCVLIKNVLFSHKPTNKRIRHFCW